jgi:hypothetical protein
MRYNPRRVFRYSFYAVFFFVLFSPLLGAQDKQATAVRVASGSVRVDGRLDEQAWDQALPIIDFIQKEPIEGASPSEQMEVRVVYDNNAVYIGARMHNRSRIPIQAPLGRRDVVKDTAEYFMVSLDTYHDRRTAYAFGVSATGVRLDRYYPQDDEDSFDEGFDPVWQAKTSMGETDWTAELWIPFSQLRFNNETEQVWGLNIERSTPARNETDYWVAVPRTQKGWASRFGDLVGIEGVEPPKRIELMPFTVGGSTINSNRDPRNPFDDGKNLKNHTGADLKMGLGPNLTLQATVNPDFGQVDADPAEVNLTVMESAFAERRPFFAEDARFLTTSLAANNFYYSRRIGAAPTVPVTGTFVDYPRTSTILGAAKLTGRLASGTSLGVLTAVTDDEFARVASLGSSKIESIKIAPKTSYGIFRVQQQFGRSGSTIGGMFTGLHRSFKSDDPLTAVLKHNEFTVMTDSTLRFRGGEYELRSYFGISHVDGTASAIERVQRSSVHYLQRPDKDYYPFDPTRTSLGGYEGKSTLERTGGKHWLWLAETEVQAPTFEANDIGRITSADGRQFNYSLKYRETTPGPVFRNYLFGVSQNNEWNFGGNHSIKSLRTNANLTFRNFWTATVNTGPNYRTLNLRETRGGPLAQIPQSWTTQTTLRNRAGAKTTWNVAFTRSTDELGGHTRNINGGISFRPGSQWQLSINPSQVHELNSHQYVTTITGGGHPETYGNRYIFAFIDRSTWSSQFRMSYTLKPDLNIDVYAEPFAASGHYFDYGELAAPRVLTRRIYGTEGTTVAVQPDGSRVITDGSSRFTLKDYDFNIRSFRSNVVLRWEWRPGSTLYLVWQQDRKITEVLGDSVGFGDVFRSLRAPGSSYFAVKMSFWLPVK